MPRGEKNAELRLRTFTAQFRLGQVVALKVDPAHGDGECEVSRGVLTHVTFGPSGERYTVAWSDRTEGEHYGIELMAVEAEDDTPRNSEE